MLNAFDFRVFCISYSYSANSAITLKILVLIFQ